MLLSEGVRVSYTPPKKLKRMCVKWGKRMKYERQESFEKHSLEDFFLPFVFVLMSSCEVAMPRIWSLEKSMARSCCSSECGGITNLGATTLDLEI